MTVRLPALYVSHGSPNLAITDTPAHRFLQRLALDLPRPRAILMISAHWCTRTPMVGTAERPETVHDFGGFDRRLYEVRYPAPGDPWLAREAGRLLVAAGFTVAEDAGRGFDHGVWVPMRAVFPQADVPIALVSMQPLADARHHHALGRALAPLREQGVLIIASGSFTHNLRAIDRSSVDAPVPGWVVEFVEWMRAHLEAGDRETLLDAMDRAPSAEANHPHDDHLLPLYVAMGAAGDEEPIRRLHASFEYGVLAMDTYQFGA